MSNIIFKLYPQVAYVNADIAYDKDQNVVEVNWSLIDAEFEKIAYIQKRAAAYPTIQEQLDMQYWDGVNGTTIWADTVASVKSENPKP